jgi:hypothetical protein
MYPQIDNPSSLELSEEAIEVLRRVFAGYRRVVVLKEFGAGKSGGRVLEVRPIKADGTPELPTVVKVATTSLIQQEWKAYRAHIENRLPHIATVGARPTIFLSAGLGGLRYPMVGIGGQEIVSLREFCDQPDVGEERVQAVLERLLRIMDNVWGFHHAAPDFDMRGSYDAALPPNLLLRAAAFPPEAAITRIDPNRLPSPLPEIGGAVALVGFAIHKIDPIHRTLTLRAPAGTPAFAVRVRIPDGEPLPDYQAHEIVDEISGVVVETRMSRLRDEVAALGMDIDPAAPHVPLAANVWVPNPLDALPRLLARTRSANIATVHGDFNLENILVDPQLGDISLIDFAEARQDHVLHDLLHLEAEVITHILPGIIARHGLDPASVLTTLGWQLHRAMGGPAHDAGMPEHPALC